MTYQAKGIILKIVDRGEADQIFYIYTREKGKITAIGKGTKKIQSKLNGQLQPFALIYLMLAPGKNQDHLAGAEAFKNFGEIKKNLRKIILGSFAMEVVEKMTPFSQPEPEIYDLLSRFFEALNKKELDPKTIESYRQNFIVKFFSILGLAPLPEIACNKNKLGKFVQDNIEYELKTIKLLEKIGP